MNDAVTPSLDKLLGAGRRKRLDDSVAALVCRAAGIVQQSDYPVAAISNLAENGGAIDSAYWLNVDFVHFVLQRDHFTLAEILPLSEEESGALLETFNQHFAGDGLLFNVGKGGAWYLSLQEDPHITTTEPYLVIGLETTSHMPRGEGAVKWNRLLNEMQMLLHEHPVNLMRERRGELAVNSAWLSGGGVLPVAAPALAEKNLAIVGDTTLVKGINLLCCAQANETRTVGRLTEIPSGANALLARKESEVWMVLSTMEDPELRWFAPLLLALRHQRLKELNLLFEYGGHIVSLQVTPSDTWKFWRKPLQLASLLPGLTTSWLLTR